MARSTLNPAAEPNVIPFIDVLLVLLIIFMVTAPKPTVDIRVDMPRGVPAPPPVGVRPTIVAVWEEGGAIYASVDGEAVAMDGLTAAIVARVIENNPAIEALNIFADARVFVRADQSMAYGNVVYVMDTVQGAGFAQVGIFAETARES